ncbi:hypothetical protein [Sphingomonas sp. S-NIH.Pt15_0812]|uniref:hypothetical protein n=1 Tax=Sphingomonas sp. S-NIH.Pt15_0812 TaxID=1920129 RepID=UPI001F497D9A|nr:hypothetical protein [Sphingomonas sp. S-NIH.Pt15_0812]
MWSLVRIQPGAPFLFSFGHCGTRRLGCHDGPFQHRVASRDPHLAVADLDTIDEQVNVFLARPAVWLVELAAEQIAEFGDDRRRDSPIASIKLPFEDGDVGLRTGLLRADVAEFGGDLRIVRAEHLEPYQLDHTGAFAFELGQPGAQPLQFGRALGDGGFRPVQPCLEKRGQPFRLDEMAGHGVDDQIVQLLHRNTSSRACIRPALDPRRAGVIAILTGLAGTRHHPRAAAIPAAAADRATGQQVRVGLRGGLAHPWVAVGHLLADRVERVFVDDRRHRDRHPLAFRPRLTGARVPAVEDNVADIGGVGQDVVQRADAEPLAPDAVAALVQVMGKARDANRALGRAVAVGLEDVADHVEHLGIVLQLLAILAGCLWHGAGAKADRRRLAVPEAVDGIGDHGATDMLGVLGRMIFVGDGEHRHGEVGRRIVAEILRHRDDADLLATQSLSTLHEVERVTEQPRQRMRQDDVDRMLVRFGKRDHLAEGTAMVVGGAARFREDANGLSAVILDPAFGGGDLIRQRQVVLLLPRGRYPRIDEDTLTREHFRSHDQAFRTARRSRRRTAGRSARPPARGSTMNRRRPR